MHMRALAVGGYMCACPLNKRWLMQMGSCDQVEGRRRCLTLSINVWQCFTRDEARCAIRAVATRRVNG